MIRKLYFILVLLLMVTQGWAKTVTGNCNSAGKVGYSYDTDTKVLTISVKSPYTSGKIDNYSTTNRAPWFKDYRTQIETVIIEEGVTSVGSWAFYNCTAIKSVTIPSTVTQIGTSTGGAFGDCTALTDVYLAADPSSLNYYETSSTSRDFITSTPNTTKCHVPIGYADSYYSKFKNSMNVTFVSDGSCGTNATYTYTPANKTLTISGTGAMTNYSWAGGNSYDNRPWKDVRDNIKTVVVNNGITTIGSQALSLLSSLTSVTLPSTGLTSIGHSAFQDCSKMASITIPSSVSSIGSYAFEGCVKLQSITIPSGVTTIASSTFEDCSVLATVTIPSTVTSIGQYAFRNCTALTSISIPESVTTIGSSAFTQCGLTSVTVPSGVTTLEECVFEWCTNLTSITLQEGLLNIDDRALGRCSSLTSITIPSTVRYVGSSGYNTSPFFLCTGITDVYLNANPANLTWRYYDGREFIESPAKTTRCHVPYSYYNTYVNNFSNVNVTFVQNSPTAADIFTISYTLNGGTVSPANPTSYNVTTTTFTLRNPTKTGYTFAGWTGSNGNTPQTTVTITKGSTGDRSYTANWTANTYTVTLNKQSGTGGSSSVTATYGSAMPSATMPTRAHYTFGGYYTSTSGGGTQYYTSAGASARSWNIASATTLYAKWTACPTATVTAPTAKTLTYTGTAQALVDAGSASGGTLQYKLGSGTWGTSIPTATASGTYTVYYKVVADDSHTDNTESSVSVTISKAALTCKADNKTVTYGDNPPTYTATYSGWKNSETSSVLSGTLSYSCSYAKNSNAGSYTITPSGVTASNYTITFQTGTLTVSKATPTVTAPTAKTLTYTGTAQALVNAGSTTGGTIQYSLTSGSGFSTTIPSQTNAGTYTVYYKVVGSTNYNDVAQSSVSVTISKAALTCKADDKTVTYGDNPPNYTATYSGWKNNETSSVLSGTLSYSCSYAKNSNAGSYTITPSGVTASNYTITFQTGTLTVNKSTPTVTAPTAKTLTYTGTAQALVNAGSTTGGTIQYSLTSGSEFSTTIPTRTNAGTYTVYYKVVGSTNYNDVAQSSVSVTISKAALTCKADNKTVTYGDNPPTYTATYSGWKNSETSSVLSGKLSYSCSYAKNSNAGSYTITPSGVTASNYTITFQTGTLTVNKAASSVTAAPTAKSLVYNGSAQTLVNAGTASGGTMNYSLNNSTWSSSLPTATAAGEYTVYYKVVGDGNHNNTSAASIKAYIDYTISYTLNGGSVASANPTRYNVTTATFTLNNPTRTGYTFAGWTGTGLASATTSVTIAKGSTGNRTYTATWTENTAILTDGGDLSALSAWTGQTCTVTYSRSFTNGKPSTVCLPFAYTKKEGDGSFYEFTDIARDESGNYVATMTEPASSTLIANTPYLYMPSATGSVDFSGTYAIPEELTAGSTTSGLWTYLGTYETVAWTEAPTGIYGFSAQDIDEQGISKGQFVKVGAYVRVKPMRCYLKYKNGDEDYTGARSTSSAAADEELPETISVRLVSATGEVNAIGTLQTTTGEITIDTEHWFDLSGRRLSGRPAEGTQEGRLRGKKSFMRGIYIHNGKKYIIK